MKEYTVRFLEVVALIEVKCCGKCNKITVAEQLRAKRLAEVSSTKYNGTAVLFLYRYRRYSLKFVPATRYVFSKVAYSAFSKLFTPSQLSFELRHTE